MNFTIDTKGLEDTSQWLEAQAKGELKFGIVKGLTDCANGARDEVVRGLPGKFSLRTAWWKPRTRYGFNVDKATKQNMQATIFTRAGWMEMQEEGGTKLPHKKHIAIPTNEVRRTKKELIRKGEKPRSLGNKAFKITTRQGDVLLANRTGKGKRSVLRILYNLVKRAKVEPRLHLFDTVREYVNTKGIRHILSGIEYALRTSKRVK